MRVRVPGRGRWRRRRMHAHAGLLPATHPAPVIHADVYTRACMRVVDARCPVWPAAAHAEGVCGWVGEGEGVAWAPCMRRVGFALLAHRHHIYAAMRRFQGGPTTLLALRCSCLPVMAIQHMLHRGHHCRRRAPRCMRR